MNQRQRQKQHARLTRAIRAMHDAVSESEGLPRSSDADVERLAKKAARSRQTTRQVLAPRARRRP